MLPGEIPCAHHGPAPAIEAEDGAWSYAALDDLANRYAHWFRDRGLAPGDRASLVMGNEPALVAAYLGAFRAGIVANPVNNRLGPEEIAYIAGHAGSRAIVATAEYAPVVASALALLRDRPAVLALGGAAEAGLLAQPATPVDARPQAGDGALLIYT